MTLNTMAAGNVSTIDVGDSPASSETRLPQRVVSVDILRGLVMVLMAIDHVRVFSGLPAGGPTPGIFFTRWITHFCAPWFVFLAGTSILLRKEKLREKAAMARYLALRGLVLVLLELTVIRICWTFNFDFAHYLLAGVIWCIGWCMVLMAVLVWLPARIVGTIGVLIILCHNIVDPFLPHVFRTLGQSHYVWSWQILYFGGEVKLGSNGPSLAVLYSIIPWIGVMAAGYWFGQVLKLPTARRDRICWFLGAAAILAFMVLRGWNIYGDPHHWGAPGGKMPPMLAFLAATKYPASLLFLLMTLGPLILLMPLVEPLRGFVANALTVFGRVPLFYYLLHIPLIHLAAIIVSLVRTRHVDSWLFANHPMFNPPAPPGYTWSLGLLYVVWAIVVVVLYFACSWYLGFRKKGAVL